MLFSIITINYNNEIGLEKTIKSVIHQNCEIYEFIIIDGGSSDGSKSIIEKYIDHLNYWISEPDNGIYNAMNKGIEIAGGEYLIFLNSGDIFHNYDVLSKVKEKMDVKSDIYYGNEIYERNKKWPIPITLTLDYLIESSIRHQATFIKKNLFDKVFYYNESLKIVSDWEFIICAIYKYSASYKYIDVIISEYEGNGISQKKENLKRRSEEREWVLRKHFPEIGNEYLELVKLRKLLRKDRIRMMVELEKSKLARVINSILQRLLLKILLNKKLKDIE